MWSDLWAFLTLQAGYNTNVVLIGVTLLGASGGVVGVFSLLRKRALISDAISHATLPGIAIGFLIGLALTGSGRHLIVLIGGAAVTGAIGVATVHWIRDHTRLAEDTAIGTVLSVFFGLGIVLLSHIQTLEVAGQAGINYMLLGSTAAMSRTEAIVIGLAAATLIAITVLMLKEFALVAFDIEYGQA
ncbi:MAG: metal ABC transporter permease, partial [Alphaproteobacteria bacterium]|nr:metal ABC transporter permease [Alphaproteobacteria bacterium]